MLGSLSSPILRPCGALLAVVLVATSAASVAAQQVDDLYEKSMAAAYQALRQFGRVDDPDENRRAQEIGYRVARASRFEEYPLTFYLIDIPEPNAFALPGGQIFITRGMLSLDLDDDELAALLGHEIAHVVLKHGTRIQRRAALLNGLSTALLIGAVASSSGSSSAPRYPGEVYDPSGADLIEGTAAAGALVTELLIRNYSRGFEDESDLEGQRWAAGAGFDPEGARRMMAKLGAAIPQDQGYGYWRTHPFNELRVRAARARGQQLKAQPPQDPSDYRRETQRKLLAVAGESKEPELKLLLEDSAVDAWPTGPAADGIRLARLHEQRDRLTEVDSLSRDYTKLLENYAEARDQVIEVDPDSSLPETLNEEMQQIRGQRDAARAEFMAAWKGGVLQTGTLEALLANFPDFPGHAAARLQLADRYARLERHSDAVDQYLKVARHNPDSEQAARAKQALAVLVGSITDLCALDQLRQQQVDAATAEKAKQELAAASATFTSLKAGADYLSCAPDGEQAVQVRERLETLAQSRLADVLLHQRIGNGGKAVQGIDDILTHAPWTEAAERLRREQRQAAGLDPEDTPS